MGLSLEPWGGGRFEKDLTEKHFSTILTTTDAPQL